MPRIGQVTIDVVPDLTRFAAQVRSELMAFGDEIGKQAGSRAGSGFSETFRGVIERDADRIKAMIGGALAFGPELVAGLQSVVGAALGAGGAVTTLAGNLAAIGPIMASVGQGVGTLIAGTWGVQAAFKAQFKALMAAQTGYKLTKIEAKKLDQTMQQLAPSARAFVVEALKLAPAVQAIQQATQQALFKDSAPIIQNLASKYLPMLRSVLTDTARQFNTFAQQAVAVATTPLFDQAYTQTLATNTRLLQIAGSTLLQLATPLRMIWVAALPLAETLAQLVSGFVLWAATSVQGAAASGRLADYFRAAGVAASTLVDIAKSLLTAFVNIYVAVAPIGQQLLDFFAQLAAKFAAFTATVQGQDAIRQWAQQGYDSIVSLVGLVQNLLGELNKIGKSADFSAFLDSLNPLIDALGTFAAQASAQGLGTQLVATITQIADAIIKVNAGGALNQFLATLATLATALATVVTAVPGLGSLIGVMLTVAATAKALKFTYALTGIESLGVAIGTTTKQFKLLKEGWSSAFATATIAQKVGRGAYVLFTNFVPALQLFAFWLKNTVIVQRLAAIASTIWTAAVEGLGVAFEFALGPIGLIIIGITLLVVAFIYAWNHFKGFRDFWIGLWDAIKTAVSVTVDWLVNTAWPAIQGFFTKLWDIIVTVGRVFATIYQVWTFPVRLAIALILATFFWLASIGWPIFKGFIDAITGIFQFGFDLLRTIVTTVLNVVWTIISTVFKAVWDVVSWYLNLVFTVWQTVWSAIVAFARWVGDNIVKPIVDRISAVVGWISAQVQAIWATFTDWFGRIVGFVADWGSRIWNAITGAVRNVVSSVASFGTQMWQSFTGVLGRALDAIHDFETTLFNIGKDIITSLWNGISGAGKWLYDHMMQFIKDNVPAPIRAALHMGSPSKLMIEYGRNVAESLATGIEDNASLVGDAADLLARQVNRTYAAKYDPLAVGAGIGASVTTTAPNVRVFIGDTELKDIVKVQVDEVDTETARQLLYGRRY